MMDTVSVNFQDWGLTPYQEAWDRQEFIFKELVDQKFANRVNPESVQTELKNHLIFCQHPHVYTLGKSGKIENLLLDEEGLKKYEATFFPINRGGDITYHGPGQLVVYPIFDLEQFFTDIHKYLRFLEEAVIQTLAHYGIKGDRYEGYTGVWIDPDLPTARKICAMGVRCSRWITMHGLAFNINTNLDYFKHIIPCGIDDKAVTSMELELGRKLDFTEVSEVLKSKIAQQFNVTFLV
ncbi:MAG: lipoyl(octanoyl) transferase LipB [Bacteroidia bacterium]|nr:lipoyl(octanoyl) transferase LipB [Bacteroidia bacterium]